MPEGLASCTPQASDAEATPSSELLVDTPVAARPAVSPVDDFEDIPTFLRAGHPDNAGAKREEGGS